LEISIICNGGKSMEEVLSILSSITQPIDELTIINTPITDYTFHDLSVRKLRLNGNNLEKIHEAAFAGPLLDSIIALDISDNKLHTTIQPGISALRNLQILNLSNNSIISLPPNAFSKYQSRFSLKELDLSVNQLTEISSHAFSGLEMLQLLALTENTLKLIPSDALKALPTLESLLLSANQFEFVPADALPLPNLKSISLEFVQISKISVDAFRQNPQLSSIYLNSNQLSHIAPQLFRPVPQLRILNMGSNELLTTIANNSKYVGYVLMSPSFNPPGINLILAFQYLKELMRLDLSDCKIETVENSAFQQLQQLKIINLRGNRLKKYNFCFKKIYIIRDVLSVNHNPWTCDQGLKWLQKWLKEDESIHITAPGYPPAKCQEPPSLRGNDIRNVILLGSSSVSSSSAFANSNTTARSKNNYVEQVSWQITLQPIKPKFPKNSPGSVSDGNWEKFKNKQYLSKITVWDTTGVPFDSMLFATPSNTDPGTDDDVKEQTKATTVIVVICESFIC
uniref:LRRCT domain-containing protein n=1 Tax=Gongylonema pulchrum TaxID=637853 RepID=A0A183CUA0_9BILA